VPLALEDDVRIPARDIASREGSVGQSATGEAYYNFGPVGPFLYYGLVGALFGWLERRAHRSPYICALLGTAMLLFFFNIRGDWISVPAQATLAAGVVLFAFATSRVIFGQGPGPVRRHVI
jgi:oligosaccharide repeat unit polymerase